MTNLKKRSYGGFGKSVFGSDAGGSAEPILKLLAGKEEWILNREIVGALGYLAKRGSQSITDHWGNINELLGSETCMLEADGRSKQGRPLRAYSKRALVWITLRAQTPNAAAFRVWLTDRTLQLFT